MKLLFTVYLSVAFFFAVTSTHAQNYDTNGDFVQTFAGSDFYGYLDGQGTQTMFDEPVKIVADSVGNLFVLDSANARIRKITPDGTVSTFAGGGTGSLPGPGTNVSLGITYYNAMTIDHANVLWITTSAGLLRIGTDAYASKTNLNGLTFTSGVCVDSANNIYYTAPDLNKIYRWRANGVLEVLAGSGNSGSLDGNGVFTSFTHPGALAADAADNIYVSDGNSHLIRRISQNSDVVTIAGRRSGDFDGNGTNTGFSAISSMCEDDAGNLIIADGNCIRKIDAQTNVTTLAGSFSQSGYTNDVAGNLARFSSAQGVCISGGTVYIADTSNERIRSITNNPMAEPVSSANLQIGIFPGLRVVGIIGRTYQIQSSSDMVGWSTRATLLLNSSPYLWIDQNPIAGNKYYRAILLP